MSGRHLSRDRVLIDLADWRGRQRGELDQHVRPGMGAVSAALICSEQTDALPVPELTVAEAMRRGIDGNVNETLPSASVPAELAYVSVHIRLNRATQRCGSEP